MDDPQLLKDQRRKQNDLSGELAQKGWYHSFELPDGSVIPGVMSLQWQRERWQRFPIPADLHGKRLLDIGTWDGWFSFEAERRGAEVTSVDRVEIPNYLRMHRLLVSKAAYRNMDFFEISAAKLGTFDIVLCLGVLYHLRHPSLAIEILCGLAAEVAIVDTFVTDGAMWRDHRNDIPTMEFYETDELNGRMDNWVGPTVGCLLAMCRAAGFARAELVAVDTMYATVACYRRWEAEPSKPKQEAPDLLSVLNVTGGRNFATTRDEYLSCWFRSSEDDIGVADLRLEAGEFGAPAFYLSRDTNGQYVANFRLPPGTAAGWIPIRLRLKNSRFSQPLRIPVDVPPVAGELVVHSVFDSLSWKPGEIRLTLDGSREGYLSCWVRGLPENCDCENVRLWASEWRLRILAIAEPDAQGYRQINSALPSDCAPGEQAFRVECGGVSSQPVWTTVK
jgi:tRNA (mo5U34)-methyltransferase